jgi:tripartite-type tricarboxylate transporter receptor subunit TctC
MPALPTIAESGLPGYDFVTWHGMLAPKGTPKAIVATLSEAIRKSMRAPELARRFQDTGLDVIGSSPEEFAVYLKNETGKWGKVIKERHMHAD